MPDASAAVLFENADWLVLDDGLEHKGTGYFIERDGVGARRQDGTWNWPVHMAEKRWCEPRGFAEAFVKALKSYGIPLDLDLPRSLHPVGRDPSGSEEPTEPVMLGVAASRQVEACATARAARETEAVVHRPARPRVPVRRPSRRKQAS